MKRGMLLLVLPLVSFISAAIRLPITYGDPLIYLVFAKSMWHNGFFFFGTRGPISGATGPLWAFLLSLFYLPTQDPSIIFSNT